jgi:hypothetical protein
MSIHAHLAEALIIVVELDYITQKHDCCSLAEFDPIECPACGACGHCSVRHQDLPVGRGCCDVETCDCFHLVTGDDCFECNGTGTLTDNQDRDHMCGKCDGEGVVA